MLCHLSIRNYLLIEHLELDLAKELTVITGETGSGKSIVVGALGLVLGERVDGQLLRDPTKRCVIELELDPVGSPLAQTWCQRHNVPFEEPMIVRRQLEPSGRSRAFVNDTPVRLEPLRELGEHLVHIHSQHHTLLLNSLAFQLELLDHFIGHTAEVEQLQRRFHQWQADHDALQRVRDEEAEAGKERSYLQFQYDELEAAGLASGEEQELKTALARAEHAEELLVALRLLEEGIGGERAVAEQLATLQQQVGKAARVDREVGELVERVRSNLVDLQDVALEAARLADRVSIDPNEAEKLRERMDLLQQLQHKHRVADEEGLLALREQLALRLQEMGSLGDRVMELERAEQDSRKRMEALAVAVSENRTRALGPLALRLEAVLHDLGMKQARFGFTHQQVAPGPSGIDRVQAQFSANKDRALQPLAKVASGGELSRVMLALISLAASSRQLSTVVFDEIDTGVSGAIAERVGLLLQRMARERQVFAISHLPQIASKAHTHLLVSKDTETEQVETTIRALAPEERVQALARMLSGKKTTKAAVANARELLGMAP